ncbi:MAG: SusC/RagA family TonB-linked outer membrane protein, partial [Bacteroidales bacterium]|nr:SusC/RagA family TonB-linked outer membrane protein [Bacteroidales bacterium]
MQKVLITLSGMLLLGWSLLAQNSTLSGTVTDAADNSPIPGVSVFVKGTTTGTITSADGTYSLSVPDDASVIVYSFVGMKTQEIAYSGQSKINVSLQSDAIDMDEVVVTGYGVTKKAAFTGAASTLGDEKIIDRTNANPVRSLEGNVAGLQMNTGSGQPGAPSTIYIRGKNSLNSGTQPLYVIDGVPMEAGTWGMRENEGSEYSPLSSLNSNDIETITVLKDATATSIYGARAANGVIVITTKKGQTGSKTRVSFGMKMGWEEMPVYTDDYKVVNADQYNELQVEGWQNYLGVDYETAKDRYYNGSIFGYSLADQGITTENMANVHWMDEVTQTGFVQEYNFSLQSAGESQTSPRVYLSAGYLDNEAFVKGKDFKRYSFRFNLDQKPSNWISYGVNSSLSYTEMNMGSGGGYFSDPVTQAM